MYSSMIDESNGYFSIVETTFSDSVCSNVLSGPSTTHWFSSCTADENSIDSQEIYHAWTLYSHSSLPNFKYNGILSR